MKILTLINSTFKIGNMTTFKDQLITDPGNRVDSFYQLVKELIVFANSSQRKADEISDKYKKDIASLSSSTLNADKKIIEIKNEDLQTAKNLKDKQDRSVEHHKLLLSKEKSLTAQQYELISSMKSAFDVAYEAQVAEIMLNFEESKKKVKNLPSKLREDMTNKFEKSKSQIETSFVQLLNKFHEQKALLLDEFYETSQPNNALWTTLNVNNSLPYSYINVANSTLTYKLFEKKYEFVIPHVIPFFNKKNIIIKCNAKDKQIALDLCNAIILRSLMALGADKLQLSLIDTLNLSSNYRDLKGLSSKVMGEFITLKSKVSDNIHSLYQRIIDVNSRCLTREFTNITQYNLKSVIKEKYNILVLSNFVSDFGHENLEVLNAILLNGPNSGVNTIIIQEKERTKIFAEQFTGNNTTIDELNTLDENSYVIDINSNHFTENLGLQPDNIKWDTVENLPYKQVVEAINQETDNPDEPLLFEDYAIDEADWWKEKATNRLVIPLGLSKQTGKVANFYMGIELPDASAIIVGAPGSGKSSFLHTLINNACLKYSHREVNFHLIDLKAVEFADYEKEDLRPPHILTVASDADREFAFSVLETVYQKMLNRQIEFKKKDYNNYEDYRLSEDIPIPHEIIIIDEFHRLFEVSDNIRDRSKEIITALVRVGRTFGMHTICATQSYEGTVGSDVIAHFPIRCVLKSSSNVVYGVLGNNDGYKDIEKVGEILVNNNFGVKYNGNVNHNRIIKSFFLSKVSRKSNLRKLNEYSETNAKNIQPLSTFNQVISNFTDNKLIKNLEYIRKTEQTEVIIGNANNSTRSDIVINLRKESGANILVVGHDEELSTKIINNIVISAALNYTKPNNAEIYIFNSILKDNNTYEIPLKYFGNKEETNNIAILNEENDFNILKGISIAIDNQEHSKNGVFLVFYAFQGFSPTLQKSTKSEAKTILTNILENGPKYGFYTIIHVDNTSNFKRILGYDGFDAFQHRIALQMSKSDSAQYIREDYASKLRDITKDYTKNYAIYYQPRSMDPYKKFMVYDNPTVEWFNNKI